MNGTDLLIEEFCSSVVCEWDTETAEISLEADPVNSTLTVTAQRLNELREQINGQTLNITFVEDFPLSYSSKDNKGLGVAFELLEFLTDKFNFTYELVRPQRNIMGSSDQYNGSILQLLETEVQYCLEVTQASEIMNAVSLATPI